MGRQTKSGMTQEERLPLVSALRLGGATQDQIAAKLGVSRDTVSRDLALLRETWSEVAMEDITAMRGLDAMRCERMLLALWPEVQRGIVAAIKTANNVLARRAALLGLDRPTLSASVAAQITVGAENTPEEAANLIDKLTRAQQDRLWEIFEEAGVAVVDDAPPTYARLPFDA